MRLLFAAFLTAFLVGPAWATDKAADVAIADDQAAADICPVVCQSVDCAWRGLWSRDETSGEDLCDCGTRRVRNIPGGNIRDDATAAWACPEICRLQGDTWNGTWETVPGAYTVCGCAYAAEYCPGAMPNAGMEVE